MRHEDSDTVEISLLLWNVWNLPSWLTDGRSRTRALQISPLLNDYDIVVLNEAFVNHAALLSATAHAFSYIPERPWFCVFSSGLMFLSKHKIVSSGYQKFHARSGVDAFTGKGIAYIQVEIELSNGRREQLTVFGTHMQASYGHRAQEARLRQARQIGEFSRARQAASSMAEEDYRQVLLGDMNMGPVPPAGQAFSQHYFDQEDARGRTHAYSTLVNDAMMREVIKFAARDRDEHEYSREICRVLISENLVDSHSLGFDLQPFTDSVDPLSDTKALCLRLTI